MTTIKQRLTDDLNEKMKAQGAAVTFLASEATPTEDMKTRGFEIGVLRLVLGDISTQEKVGKKAVEFDDKAVAKVLDKAVKQRRETATIYANAGVQDRADKESREADFIETYMPEPVEAMSAAALAAVVDGIVNDLGVTGMSGMGQVMKAAKEIVGDRSDGRTISEAVRARLG